MPRLRSPLALALVIACAASCPTPVDDDAAAGAGEGEGEGDAVFPGEGEGEGDGAAEGEGEGEGESAPPGDMVEVPSGTFTMGCDDCGADEAPRHAVALSRYFIDVTEVTQAAYAECVDAGACARPPTFTPETQPSLPVTSMTWDDAVAYCAFVDKRLPTEAEWERAARGDDDDRRYPWGDEEASCALANVAGCVDGDDALPVGSLPAGASPFGALDMAGNVWEWTADYYAADAYASHAPSDPAGPAAGEARVYRGGGSGNDASLATTTNRADTYSPDFGGTGLGFRCARDG